MEVKIPWSTLVAVLVAGVICYAIGYSHARGVWRYKYEAALVKASDCYSRGFEIGRLFPHPATEQGEPAKGTAGQ